MQGPASEDWVVLINTQEQYALYPSDLDLPGGWRPAGFTGSEQDCRTYVDEHWTDMRPLDVRRSVDG
jgi:MbtH protein